MCRRLMDFNVTKTTIIGHHNPSSYVLNGKIMLCSVIILFAIVLFLLCFHSYARWVFEHRHRRRRRRARHHFIRTTNRDIAIVGGTNNSNITVIPPQGLDVSVLKKIPTFIYSSTAAASADEPPLECAVCLSEFEDSEKGRVLPKCNHAFHVDCIDMWFHSHSSCPLCRAPVRFDTPVTPLEIVVEEAVPVSEPPDSGNCSKRGEMGSSSSSLPPQTERVSIVVESGNGVGP